MKKNYLKWNIDLFKYKKKKSGFIIIRFLNIGSIYFKSVPYNYKKLKKKYFSTNNNNSNNNSDNNLKNNNSNNSSNNNLNNNNSNNNSDNNLKNNNSNNSSDNNLKNNNLNNSSNNNLNNNNSNNNSDNNLKNNNSNNNSDNNLKNNNSNNSSNNNLDNNNSNNNSDNNLKNNNLNNSSNNNLNNNNSNNNSNNNLNNNNSNNNNSDNNLKNNNSNNSSNNNLNNNNSNNNSDNNLKNNNSNNSSDNNLNNNKSNNNSIIVSEDFTRQIEKLVIENFDGRTSEALIRFRLQYTDSKGKAVKLDRRSWAFLKYDMSVIKNGKKYKGICMPLLGVSALINFKASTSKISKKTLNRLIEKMDNVKPIKVEEFQNYAGLLTEKDIIELLKLIGADFDPQRLKDFVTQFSHWVNVYFSDDYLPVFWLGEQKLVPDFDESITAQTLNMNNNTVISTEPITEVENNKLMNLDLTVLEPRQSNLLEKAILIKNSELLSKTIQGEPSPFSQKNAVYCIKYNEKPGEFIIGHTTDLTLLECLKRHKNNTGFIPIVVFALQQIQIQQQEPIHPETLEIEFQMVVATDLDLLASRFNTTTANLNQVRKSDPFKFTFDGTEADLTRICIVNTNLEIIKHFRWLSTLEIQIGNYYLSNY